MMDVTDEDSAIQVARKYADEECLGEFGEVQDVVEEDAVWIVEYTTHTFDAKYTHSIRINRVGNVFTHERQP